MSFRCHLFWYMYIYGYLYTFRYMYMKNVHFDIYMYIFRYKYVYVLDICRYIRMSPRFDELSMPLISIYVNILICVYFFQKCIFRCIHVYISIYICIYFGYMYIYSHGPSLRWAFDATYFDICIFSSLHVCM